MFTEQHWVFDQFLKAIPAAQYRSVVAWATIYVKLVGSARSENYDASITPWTREPLECAANGTRRCTFIKPIQAGGSSVGEIALLYWLANWSSGDICCFWPNNESADERFDKHTEKKIRACQPVMDRLGPDRHKFTRGQIIFPHCNFVQQGVSLDRNVASDSFRGIVNEELHITDEWTPGRLEQVYGRTTAYWNSVVFNISNASMAGTELHKAFLEGTQEVWEVKCPSCQGYHRMHIEKYADGSGLRYDADVPGCRLGNGDYNYNLLEPTIHYRFECGHTIKDDITVRRALSLSGRYSAPTNRGASLTDRSFTLEAVSIDYIPWLDLIKQRHKAQRAYKRGDRKPWWDYLRERECKFVNISDDRPKTRGVAVSSGIKKDRAGMPNRAMRVASGDFQKGNADQGETSHWWLFIQDFDEAGNALVVWEGKCVDDAELVGTINRHDVDPLNVALDSGFDAEHVYQVCIKYGYCCFKVDGGKDGQVKYYTHEDGSLRIYSTPVPLVEMKGWDPSRENPDEEPMFWHVSKWGAMQRLAYVRESKEIRYEVPEDVSEDFKKHFNAWEPEMRLDARTNERKLIWNPISEDDHLFQCAAYNVIAAEMEGLIGIPPEVEQLVEEVANA